MCRAQPEFVKFRKRGGQDDLILLFTKSRPASQPQPVCQGGVLMLQLPRWRLCPIRALPAKSRHAPSPIASSGTLIISCSVPTGSTWSIVQHPIPDYQSTCLAGPPASGLCYLLFTPHGKLPTFSLKHPFIMLLSYWGTPSAYPAHGNPTPLRTTHTLIWT